MNNEPSKRPSERRKKEKRKQRIKNQMRASKRLHDKMLGVKPKPLVIRTKAIAPEENTGNDTHS